MCHDSTVFHVVLQYLLGVVLVKALSDVAAVVDVVTGSRNTGHVFAELVLGAPLYGAVAVCW